MNKRILVVFGTRPEAIKMAPVVKELDAREGVQPIVCVTAQHREILDQVLGIFNIKPDYDLDIMKPGQSLAQITSVILDKFSEVLQEVKPDLVLVHGDTTTAFATCLAAFYQQIPVGHVEAGLRTYDRYSPFPEELNRQMIDRMAERLYAPTQQSKDNLTNSLNKAQHVVVTGNTAIDALRTTVTDAYQHKVLDWADGNRIILLTAHRRENWGEPMRQIFRAVRRVVAENNDIRVVYPMHPNPKVREIALEAFKGEDHVRLIDPLDVLDFHNFMKRSFLIASDSGGVQEEAPSLGKPVLVLRDTTERPEGVDAGTLRLVGTSEDSVYSNLTELLSSSDAYSKMSQRQNPYGDGYASRYIVDDILTL